MRDDITPEDIRWWIENSPREWWISAFAIIIMIAYLVLQIIVAF